MQRLVALARWEEAALTCDELLAHHGRSLIRGEDGRYVNVTDEVNRRLARWPTEGQEAFRSRFNHHASGQLAGLGDAPGAAVLLEVADRWWLTSAGGEADRVAAERLLAEGRIEAAAGRFDRLWRHHPDFQAVPDAAIRAAVAWTLLGRTGPAEEAARRARDIGGRAMWYGREAPVDEILAALPEPVTPAAVDDVPPALTAEEMSADGDPLWRTRVADEAKPLWSRQALRETAAEPDVVWSDMNCRPTLAYGRVYVQDPAHVYALNLQHGLIAWQFRSVPTDDGGVGPAGSRSQTTRIANGPQAVATLMRRAFAIVAHRYERAHGRMRTVERAALVALDADTGEERWRVTASSLLDHDIEEFAGRVFFDGVPLAHDGGVHAVIHREQLPYTATVYLVRMDPETGEPVWLTQLAAAVAEEEDAACAPSRLSGAADAIVVETGFGVGASVSASTGRIRWLATDSPASSVRDGVSDGHAASPHVSATDDLGVVVCGDVVQCYTRSMDAWAWLDGLIEASPADPDAQLALARYALARPGLGERGLDAIDHVLHRTRRPDDLRDPLFDIPRLRRHVFDVALEAARQVTESDVSELDQPVESLDASALLDGLFERAARVARDPEAGVRHRMIFADAYGRIGAPREAVRVLQGVLNVNDLREHRMIGSYPPVRAGDLAEGAIAARIHEHGREVYAPFDVLAREALDSARTGRTPVLEEAAPDPRGELPDPAAALEQVYRRWPNAVVAPRAMRDRAALLRDDGRTAEAARLLQEVLRRHALSPGNVPDAVRLDGAEVIRELVEVYRAAGNVSAALYWLARGHRDFPDVQTGEPDDRRTFAAIRQALRDEGETLAPRRPSIAPPFGSPYRVAFEPPVRLLEPRFAPFDPDATLDDRIVVHHAGGIMALDPRSGEPIWSAPIATAGIPALLGMRDKLLLFATLHEVLAVDRDSGQVRWQHGRLPPQFDSPLIDPEILVPFRDHALSENLLVNVFEDGRAVALRLTDGEVRWDRVLPHPYRGPILADHERVVYASMLGGATALVALDALTGEPAGHVVRDDDRLVSWLSFSAEGLLLASGSGWLTGYAGDPRAAANRQGGLERMWTFDRPEGGPGASVVMGLWHAWLADSSGGVAAVALDDGDLSWKTPMDDGHPSGPPAYLWLDAGRLYGVGRRGVTAWDAETGRRLWSHHLADGLTVRTAELASEAVLVAVRGESVITEMGSLEPLALICLDRETGEPQGEDDSESWALGQYERIYQVGIYNGAIVVREGATLVGWPEIRHIRIRESVNLGDQ